MPFIQSEYSQEKNGLKIKFPCYTVPVINYIVQVQEILSNSLLEQTKGT
jgi:hypothetical protein